jgi:FixJ family two-component response regulator
MVGPMKSTSPVVYVVDDDVSMRKALRNLLESVPLEVATYASPEEFLKTAVLDSPSCLVLDIRLQATNGLDLQAALIERGIHIPIIFITGHGDIAMSVRAMKAGAIEFLTKPFQDQDLLDAIYRAVELDRAYRRQQAELGGVRKRYFLLTPRERQVMTLVVAGMSNKQIACDIGIRQATVKFHRGQVMRKMQADSLPALVRMAQQIDLPSPKSRSTTTNG